MIGRILTVLLVTLAAWLAAVLVTPALGLATPYVVSVSAMVLCLASALGTLILSEKAKRWPPHIQVAVLLGSTGLRLFGVVVAAVVLTRSVPTLAAETGFVTWVIGFYLVTLAAEAYVLAKSYSVPQVKS